MACQPEYSSSEYKEKHDLPPAALDLILRLVLAVIRMYNLVQILEARAPLQGNVSVQQLLPGLDVACGIYLEPILVEEALHMSVRGALLAGVVKGRAAASHAPGLCNTNTKRRGTRREGVSDDAKHETQIVCNHQ